MTGAPPKAPHVERPGRTFAQFLRLVWIDARMFTHAKINRRDLADAFGISIQQASHDLREFQAEHPGMIEYDVRAKTYARARSSTNAYPDHLHLLVLETVNAVQRFHRKRDTTPRIEDRRT